MDEQTEIEAAVAAIKAVEMDVEEVERRVFRAWQQRRSAQIDVPDEPTAEEVVARIARGEVPE